jgi:hypothetical protein
MARSRSLASLAAALFVLGSSTAGVSCSKPVAAAAPPPVLVSVDPSIGSPGAKFRPRLGDRVGHRERGLPLLVQAVPAPNAGLVVTVEFSGGFSGFGVELGLEHGEAGSIRCQAFETSFTDVVPPGSERWVAQGRVILSRSDWEAISAEHPLFVKFELTRIGTEPAQRLDGYVRLPD